MKKHSFLILLISLLLISCLDKKRVMEKTDLKQYIQDNNLSYELDDNCLVINSLSFNIIPPIHLIRNDNSLIKEFDYSEIEFNHLVDLEELDFNNHFIKALPLDIVELKSLEYLDVSYGVSVDLVNEIEKIKKIENLAFLDLSSSLLSEIQIDLVYNNLRHIEIIFD